MTPLQKALGAVVLNTIFILLGLRGSYSAAHIFVLDVFDFHLCSAGTILMLFATPKSSGRANDLSNASGCICSARSLAEVGTGQADHAPMPVYGTFFCPVILGNLTRLGEA